MLQAILSESLQNMLSTHLDAESWVGLLANFPDDAHEHDLLPQLSPTSPAREASPGSVLVGTA